MRAQFVTSLPTGLFLLCALTLASGKTKEFDQSGKITAVFSSPIYVYQVETDQYTYRFEYEHYAGFLRHPAEYKAGDKAVAVGDVVHFRIDGDWAYLPGADDQSQEKFRILSTEMKVIPPVPAMPSGPAETDSKKIRESGVVIGTGQQIHGSTTNWARPMAPMGPTSPPPGPTAPSNGQVTTVIPTTPSSQPGAPVMGTPVTGGPPVMVMPTGPTTAGAPVTGPVIAGGAPPAAPRPAGSGMVIGVAPRPSWDHIVRVLTAAHTYVVECPSDQHFAIGDNLTFRVDGKHLIIASDPSNPKQEDKYKILSVALNATRQESKPTESDSKQNPAAKPDAQRQ